MGVMMQQRLIDSMLPVLSMPEAANSCFIFLRFGLAPRWRGLNRFPKVMKVSFADGAKLEDISKVCVCVIQK